MPTTRWPWPEECPSPHCHHRVTRGQGGKPACCSGLSEAGVAGAVGSQGLNGAGLVTPREARGSKHRTRPAISLAPSAPLSPSQRTVGSLYFWTGDWRPGEILCPAVSKEPAAQGPGCGGGWSGRKARLPKLAYQTCLGCGEVGAPAWWLMMKGRC